MTIISCSSHASPTLSNPLFLFLYLFTFPSLTPSITTNTTIIIIIIININSLHLPLNKRISRRRRLPIPRLQHQSTLPTLALTLHICDL